MAFLFQGPLLPCQASSGIFFYLFNFFFIKIANSAITLKTSEPRLTCFPAQACVAYTIKAFNQAFLLPSCVHLSALMHSNKPHGVDGFTKATPQQKDSTAAKLTLTFRLRANPFMDPEGKKIPWLPMSPWWQWAACVDMDGWKTQVLYFSHLGAAARTESDGSSNKFHPSSLWNYAQARRFCLLDSQKTR